MTMPICGTLVAWKRLEYEELAKGSGERMIGMKTNVQLQLDVLDDLRKYARADLDEIGVHATDGIVTLAGRVKNHAEKWSIVHAAECVTGVKAIVNEIEVESRKGEEIAREVLDRLRTYGAPDAFHRDGYRLDDTIKIHVERGWIIVKGTVASKYLRTKIEDVVGSVTGVRGVSNRIRTTAVVATRGSRTKSATAPRLPARPNHGPLATADALISRPS